MKVPLKRGTIRRSISTGSVASTQSAAPLADVVVVAPSPSISEQVKTSCMVDVKSLEDSFNAMKALNLSIEAQT